MLKRRIILGTYALPSTQLRSDRDTVFSYGQWRLNPLITLHGGAEYVRLDERGKLVAYMSQFLSDDAGHFKEPTSLGDEKVECQHR